MTNEEKTMTGYPSIDKPWLKYYGRELDKEPFNGNLYEHVYSKNKDYLENKALQFYGRNISYCDLFHMVDKVAQVFLNYGIRSGDNISLLMSSCPEMVYILLGANKIGAVVNMVNPVFDDCQIRDRVNDSEADVLIVLDQLVEKIIGIQDELCVKHIVVVPIEQSMPTIIRLAAHHKLKKKISYTTRVLRWDDFVDKYSDGNNIEITGSDENLPAIMVYSSGTTGASKGIVLTNKGINATIAHYEYTGFEYDRSDKFLQIIPTWFSTGTVICLVMPLCLGLQVILEPVFSEESFARDIFKYKPNMIMGATSLWLHMMKTLKKEKKDLSFVTYPITGGEKILPETEEELNRLLKINGCKAHLTTGYGMCELGSTVTSTSMKYWKVGTTGYPILGVTVAAFDVDTNRECKYGERGEIRVLTPARMKEYYKRPDATAEFLWKDTEGREWGCTGDIGYIEQDGFVYVQGRASDFFTNKEGKKVYCFDIEDEILKADEVYQCEVVSKASDEGYEYPIAFVVLKEGVQKESKEIINALETYCNKHIEQASVPTEYIILDKFPVKASGKRDMEKLMEMAGE